MDDSRGKFQYAGLKFLYDMELIDDPQLINNMKLNIFDVSSSIKDVEFLSSYHHKTMLIWLDVSWFGKKFLEKRILTGVADRVQQLLPNFRFRVITDRKIFDLALAKLETILKGANNEKVRSYFTSAVDAELSSSEREKNLSTKKSSSSGNTETES